MKKLLILSILLSSVLISCDDKSEPEPEAIRAYCHLYHFIPQMSSVMWEVDGVELPEELGYSNVFPGAILLEGETEAIEFVVKDPGSEYVLVSQFLSLEKNKYYNVIVCGSAPEPIFIFNEIELSRPQAGNVKVQALHSILEQGPIDVYMGDTTQRKKLVTALEYLETTDPFEVSDIDMRVNMTVTGHSDEFDPDSVLLTSDYNEIISGASYLTVVAPFTQDTSSRLTFWLYTLPTE